MLPNFLIIGAAKAGTTSLWNYLRLHPQVFVSEPKELKFFAPDRNWTKGVAWYEKHFEGADAAVAVGESSGSYTRYPYAPGAPARIAEVLPDVRLIYLVRHPIERALSHYLMSVRSVWETEAFVDKAILRNPRYLDESRYAMQIEQYLPYFPRERLLIVRSEELRDARGPTMKRVFEFLGVNSSWIPDNLDVEFNTARSKENRVVRPAAKALSRTLKRIPGRRALLSAIPPSLIEAKRRVGTRDIGPTVTISAGVRRELEARLRPDVQRLRGYIGDEFDGWGIG